MLRYRIYQMVSETSRAFKELSEIGTPEPSDYVMVYEGMLKVKPSDEKAYICILNGLFRIFNMDNRPEDYLARSVSVSDVISLYDNEGDESNERFYYCGGFGFSKIVFDGAKAETPAKPEYEIMVVSDDDADLLYSNEKQKEKYLSIGHLRGDFSPDGKKLWTTFTDHSPELKSLQFRIQFDSVINYLIRIGMLKSFNEMAAFFYAHPEYKLHKPTHRERECGFKIETERFRYFFRTILRQGDYNLYCFCYLRRDSN